MRNASKGLIRVNLCFHAGLSLVMTILPASSTGIVHGEETAQKQTEQDSSSASSEKSENRKVRNGKVESEKNRIPRLEPIALPAISQMEESLKRGIQYLKKSQNKNGSWGSATRTKGLNIFAPIPGAHHAFRMGTSALCISALCELEEDFPEATPILNKAETWLYKELPRLKRATPTAIYNVWGHGYAIQALVRLHERNKRKKGDPKVREQIVQLIRSQYDMLERYETVNGGWGYYDFALHTRKPGGSPTSFTTATILVAFAEARDLGKKEGIKLDPPAKIVKRAMTSIYRQQKSDFTYAYGEYLRMRPMLGINRPGGSLGRSQACNIALRMWKDEKITDQVLRDWLHRLFARNGWLDIGRKRPVPHEAWFQVAGYFYYYGHYYGALCIKELPQKEQEEFQAHMATLMLQRQEKDGSWWDYPLYTYHQPYGTGFALMTLYRCLPQK